MISEAANVNEWGEPQVPMSFESIRYNTTEKFARSELAILEHIQPHDPLCSLKNEIIKICSYHESCPELEMNYLLDTIKKLISLEPITPITGEESEWVDISDIDGGNTLYQNSRQGDIFKEKDRCKYLSAIIWNDGTSAFSGRAYVDNTCKELISSSQIIKEFPFVPKTFYLDVIPVPISKNEAEERNLHYIEDGNGDCHYNIIKNPKALNTVFKYYHIACI